MDTLIAITFWRFKFYSLKNNFILQTETGARREIRMKSKKLTWSVPLLMDYDQFSNIIWTLDNNYQFVQTICIDKMNAIFCGHHLKPISQSHRWDGFA